MQSIKSMISTAEAFFPKIQGPTPIRSLVLVVSSATVFG